MFRRFNYHQHTTMSPQALDHVPRHDISLFPRRLSTFPSTASLRVTQTDHNPHAHDHEHVTMKWQRLTNKNPMFRRFNHHQHTTMPSQAPVMFLGTIFSIFSRRLSTFPSTAGLRVTKTDHSPHGHNIIYCTCF